LIEKRNDERDFIKALREQYQDTYKEAFLPTDAGTYMTLFFFASVLNSISATFWILYYLLTNENGRAFEEIRQEIIVQNGDINKLEIIDSTINEALRLVGTIFLTRCAHQEDDTTLNLHNGLQLRIYPTISHYDQTISPQPNIFKHDRFLRLDKVSQSYISFGNGKSKCPGRFFVRNEIKIIFLALVKQIDLELVGFEDEKASKLRKER
jgi:cytochrome P450